LEPNKHSRTEGREENNQKYLTKKRKNTKVKGQFPKEMKIQ